MKLPKNFVPMRGCAEKCPILLNEHDRDSEICCYNSRRCCFYCDDNSCPILDKYSEIIDKFDVNTDTESMKKNDTKKSRTYPFFHEIRGNKACQINQFIELRLINKETIIYIDGQKFRGCKYLLFNIQNSELKNYDNIGSIDEARHQMPDESSIRKYKPNISPHQEFIAHCSNIQAWAENDYDTRLLEMKLAFPILRKLVYYGDKTAQKVWKDEIAIRIESAVEGGLLTIPLYIIQSQIFLKLTYEEISSIFHDRILQKITNHGGINALRILYYLYAGTPRELFGDQYKSRRIYKDAGKYISSEYFQDDEFSILIKEQLEYGDIRSIAILHRLIDKCDSGTDIMDNTQLIGDWSNTMRITTNIKKLVISRIQRFHLCYLFDASDKATKRKGFHKNPSLIGSLFPNLEVLQIKSCEIKYIPRWITNLKNLRILNLSDNHIKSISILQELANPEKIEELYLQFNNIKKLHPGIANMKNLRILKVFNNRIENIPDEIGKLTNLEILHIASNPILYISPKIGKLHNLQIFDMSANDQNPELPQTIGNLKNLRRLDLFNKFDYNTRGYRCIPDCIKELEKLEYLDLTGNMLITEIPDFLCELRHLKEIRVSKQNKLIIPDCITENDEITVKIKEYS